MEDVGSGIESSQHYSEKDFQNQSIGATQSFEALIPYLKTYKAMDEVSEISIPTYFVQGSFDLATPTEFVKDYFKNISAPLGKEFVEFKRSAHFPMYEEPVLFAELISQIDAK